MKNQFKKLIYALLLISAFASCVKNEVDPPPTGGSDPVVSGVRISIKNLLALYDGDTTKIKTDVYVVGIVAADDREGNIYKELIIQDETGGMSIQIDMSNFYTDYPVGRRVFVKCKDLWMDKTNELITFGGYIDTQGSIARIPLTLVNSIIVKGSYYHPVMVDTVDIANITDDHMNTLVCLKNVEFDAASINSTYADAINKLDLNKDINDCNGNTIILRSSGYSKFAGDTVPKLNGTITAICQRYNNDFQLKIRDTRDVAFTKLRCNGSGGTPTLTTLDSIRTDFNNGITVVNGSKKIKGIVISDKDNGNVDTRNMFIQDSKGGIVVRFAATHAFALNDEVEVDVSGMTLSEFNGLLQITNVPNANAAKTGTGTITPKAATVQDIINNQEAWESTLVIISNATINNGIAVGYNSGGSSGLPISDGTNNAILYTRTQATFGSTLTPTTPKNVTCLISTFNTMQLMIRNINDVQ
ncbi:MAG: hypothetical protein IPO27_01310 [Bacteroidetes bacterium]|nr:hypothetical protein [Bacteroidota bacterium]